jgi:anti-sigma regulatory factor (Ser/Thr protein kinase)
MTQTQETGEEILKLTVPSCLKYIRPIQMFIGQLAQQLGFCRTRIYDIELIIDEVCSNAIEHGSETRDSGIDVDSFAISDCGIPTNRLYLYIGC